MLNLAQVSAFGFELLNAGLDYLHTRADPVIHRDLKCDNIFINGNLAFFEENRQVQ